MEDEDVKKEEEIEEDFPGNSGKISGKIPDPFMEPDELDLANPDVISLEDAEAEENDEMNSRDDEEEDDGYGIQDDDEEESW